MGYCGALALLVLSLAGMKIFGWEEPSDWGPFFVFAALWFFLGMVPSMLFLHDDAPLEDARRQGLVKQSFGRVVETVRHASRHAGGTLEVHAHLVDFDGTWLGAHPEEAATTVSRSGDAP